MTARLLTGLLAANALAWGWAWWSFADSPALLATALLAWTFGLRHAVDADHIAAIDNVVRRLMGEGKPAVAVGFFFSLGHSTVVLLLSALVAGTAILAQDRLGWLQATGGVVGSALSGGFLLGIAAINLLMLRGVWRQFTLVRRGGTLTGPEIGATGPLARMLRPVLAATRASWQMYPVGFLFGLGFDTATEIGLLGISARQSAAGLSPWQIMVFPALFTAGMALVDTADSAMMVGAYGWAFVNPLRKLWYNLTLTVASVAVAVLIGGVEIAGLLVDQLGLEGGVWSAISALNDNLGGLGFAVVALFALCWGVSAAVYRWKRLDEVPGLTPSGP